jgi:hypothetical protein
VCGQGAISFFSANTRTADSSHSDGGVDANRTTVEEVMTYLILGLIIAELFASVRARSAVVGSRQRYVALSLRRVASWAVSLAFIAEGLISLAIGDGAYAVWYLVFGIGGLYLEIRMHKDDDDWFNGRGTKIKKGIRRMLTAPRPQTAPAFGMMAG